MGRYDSFGGPVKSGCRSPRGERGLKYFLFSNLIGIAGGRSPRGERGLKFLKTYGKLSESCRSPRGERGLKYRR